MCNSQIIFWLHMGSDILNSVRFFYTFHTLNNEKYFCRLFIRLCQKKFTVYKYILYKYRIGHEIDIWLLPNHDPISRLYETCQKNHCWLMHGHCQNSFFHRWFTELNILFKFLFFCLSVTFSIISRIVFLRICLLPFFILSTFCKIKEGYI